VVPGRRCRARFDHIERVYGMCQRIGREEGADRKSCWPPPAARLAGSHPGKGSATTSPARGRFAAEVLAAEGWDEEHIRASSTASAPIATARRGSPATLEAKFCSTQISWT
jgi:hypothetical protein